MLVCSLGDGTHGFTLDEVEQSFVLTHPNMKIPKQGPAVMFNHANMDSGWHDGVREFVRNKQRQRANAVLVRAAAATASAAAAHAATNADANADVNADANGVDGDDASDGGGDCYFKYSGAFVGDVHSLLTKASRRRRRRRLDRTSRVDTTKKQEEEQLSLCRCRLHRCRCCCC